MLAFIIDVGGVSIWIRVSEGAFSAIERPFATQQRIATILLQFLYIVVNYKWILRAARRVYYWLPVVAFCAASAIWSWTPQQTVGSAARLSLLLLTIGLAAERHGPPTLRKDFLLVLAAIFGLNVASLAVPSISIETGVVAGSFRGLFAQKNAMGSLCSLCLAFALAALREDRITPRGRLALSGFICGVLGISVLTRSATTLGIEAFLFLIFGISAKLGAIQSAGKRFAALATLVGTSAVLLTSGGFAIALGVLDRDPTLSRRSDIWAFVWRYILQKPILGWGYNAFPIVDLLKRDLRRSMYFVVGSAHSSYLEILAGIGLVGLCLYGLTLLVVVFRTIRAPRADFSAAVLVLSVYAINGATESLGGLLAGPLLAALLVAVPTLSGPTRKRIVSTRPSQTEFRSSGQPRPAGRHVSAVRRQVTR
jgi:O-antigen ligase